MVGKPCSSDLPLRCGPKKPGQSVDVFVVGASGGAADRNVCPTSVNGNKAARNRIVRMNGHLGMSGCYNEAYRPRQGNDDVVLKKQADSESETGRISLQRLRGGCKEKEKSL